MGRSWIKISFFLILIFCFLDTYAQKAPAGMTSAIIIKILQFEKGVLGTKDIDIFIIGAEDVATELKKLSGKTVGKLNIKSVESGNDLPSTKPSIIFNDNTSLAEKVSSYSNSNKIISISREREVQDKGNSILIELASGSPLIQISSSDSKIKGLEWNPAIFKIAKKLD